MLAVIPLCFALLFFGQEDGQSRRPGGQQPPPNPAAQATPSTSPAPSGGAGQGQQRGPQERPSPAPEETPVITHHEIRAGGKVLRYTATTGMMPIKNREGETEARRSEEHTSELQSLAY